MSEVRAFAFRQRALQAHDKAMRAGIPEETQRAWLIIERDWIKMAERDELNDAVSWLDGAARLRLTTVAASGWDANKAAR